MGCHISMKERRWGNEIRDWRKIWHGGHGLSWLEGGGHVSGERLIRWRVFELNHLARGGRAVAEDERRGAVVHMGLHFAF